MDKFIHRYYLVMDVDIGDYLADVGAREVCLLTRLPHARAEMHYLALKSVGENVLLVRVKPRVLLAPYPMKLQVNLKV